MSPTNELSRSDKGLDFERSLAHFLQAADTFKPMKVISDRNNLRMTSLLMP